MMPRSSTDPAPGEKGSCPGQAGRLALEGPWMVASADQPQMAQDMEG